ncbi:hypothetical protein [Streptomyces sp. H27-D2]|uniref:hypothetical protein n=1 Tax=Streptomyces sp. H27-D2 TaxID=3046304 RepID=UPI002DBD7D8F|nr:hypothetical protein [Streptomyces sp. H27-D2]MEC4016922.1 hypothetical protein [Streptomyces sp. H27-D2]
MATESVNDQVSVLGATGKTGRRVVSRLRAAGRSVRAASRSASQGISLRAWRIAASASDRDGRRHAGAIVHQSCSRFHNARAACA